jgi:hypothetical protein
MYGSSAETGAATLSPQIASDYFRNLVRVAKISHYVGAFVWISWAPMELSVILDGFRMAIIIVSIGDARFARSLESSPASQPHTREPTRAHMLPVCPVPGRGDSVHGLRDRSQDSGRRSQLSSGISKAAPKSRIRIPGPITSIENGML